MEPSEWRRQRAIAQHQQQHLHDGGSGSSGIAPSHFRFGYRWMPPPSTYETPFDSDALASSHLTSFGIGIGESALLNEDAVDSALTINQEPMHATRPHRTDEEIDEPCAGEEEEEDAQMDESGAAHAPSHQPAPHAAVTSLGAPATWTPVKAAHSPSSAYFAQQQQQPSYAGYGDAHDAAAASDAAAAGPPSSSRKRARTSNSSDVSTGRDSDVAGAAGSTSASASGVAEPFDRSRSRARKKFAKAHQPAPNRQVVPTLTVAHTIVREEDDQMRDAEPQQQQQQADVEAKQAASASEPRAPSTPSSPSSSSSASATSSSAAAGLRWTRGPKGSRAGPRAFASPQRHEAHPAAATTPPRPLVPQVASAGWKVQAAPPPPPRLAAPTPLAQTGALWIQQFNKQTLVSATKQEVSERIQLLQEQVKLATRGAATTGAAGESSFNTSLMPLGPVFFSMGLSLLIRQPSLARVQADALAALCQTAVAQRVIPPGLAPKLQEHLRDFARRCNDDELHLLADTLAKQQQDPTASAGPMHPARFGGAAGEAHAQHQQPQRSHGSREQEFHMLGSHSHSSGGGINRAARPPVVCTLCGIGVIGTTATVQAHLRACAEAKRREEAKHLPTHVKFDELGLPVSRQAFDQQQQQQQHQQHKRYPALSSSFVMNPSSGSSAGTGGKPAGTSFNDAISIGSDDDSDAGGPTVALVSANQRLSLDAAVAFVHASFAADELIERQKLPLVDPLTLTRIEVPVRSKHCSHLRCMDLAILLQHAQDVLHRKKQLKCPICHIDMQIADLVVDSFLELRLKEAEAYPDINDFTLHRDCTFDFCQNNGNGNGSGPSAACAATKSSSAPLAAAPASAAPLARQASDGKSKRPTQVVHHVDLLDDDDEDDDVAQAALEAERKLATRRRMAEKRPVGSPPAPAGAATPRLNGTSRFESDSDSTSESELDRSCPVTPSSLARSVSPQSRTPSPLQHPGGFSSGEESAASTAALAMKPAPQQPHHRNTIVLPRSAWNRADLVQRTDSSGPRRPPAQLAPSKPATVVSSEQSRASKDAPIDLTCNSSDDAESEPSDPKCPEPRIPNASRIKPADAMMTAAAAAAAAAAAVPEADVAAPAPPVGADADGSANDSKTATLGAMRPRRSPVHYSPNDSADSLLMQLADAPEKSLARPPEDLLSSSSSPSIAAAVNSNMVFSPGFLTPQTSSPIVLTELNRHGQEKANTSPPPAVAVSQEEADASLVIIEHNPPHYDDAPVHSPSSEFEYVDTEAGAEAKEADASSLAPAPAAVNAPSQA